MRNRWIGTCGRLAMLAAAVGLSGCLEIDQVIELRADGSGRFIEVIRLDDRLVEASRAAPELAGLTEMLGQARAKERAKDLGEAELVSYELEDLGGQGRRGRAVYAFKDINRFVLPAWPHRGSNWPSQKFTFRLGGPTTIHEAWRNAYYIRRPLQITLAPKTIDTAPVENPLSPAEKEKLQELLPVVRAMAEGFRVSLRLEAFGPVDGGTTSHTIVRVTDEDLADDDTLMKLLLWNRFPDKLLGARDALGRSGQLRSESYSVGIGLPYAATPASKPAR